MRTYAPPRVSTKSYWANSASYYQPPLYAPQPAPPPRPHREPSRHYQRRRRTYPMQYPPQPQPPPPSPRRFYNDYQNVYRSSQSYLPRCPMDDTQTKSMEIATDETSSEASAAPDDRPIYAPHHSAAAYRQQPQRPGKFPRDRGKAARCNYAYDARSYENINGLRPAANGHATTPVNVDKVDANWDMLRRRDSTPNLNLLRRVNRRAKMAERSLLYMKIVAMLHLVFGLVLAAVDWAKILIVWAHVAALEAKILLLLRTVYPLLIIVLGCVALAAGVLNRRGATKTVLLCAVILLTSLAVAASYTPLVQSMLEAIEVKRAREAMGNNSMSSRLFGATTEEPLSANVVPTVARYPALASYSESLSRDGQYGVLSTVSNLLIVYCGVCGFHVILTILTIFVSVRLLRVQ